MRKHTYDFSYVLPSCLCGDSLVCRECSFPPPPQSPTSKGKGKVLPITGHEGPKWEQTYSSTLPSTLALDGVGSQHHTSAALPPGKTRYPLYKRLGGPQGRTGRGRKISPPPHRDSIPGPSRTQRVAIPTLRVLNYCTTSYLLHVADCQWQCRLNTVECKCRAVACDILKTAGKMALCRTRSLRFSECDADRLGIMQHA